MTCRADRLSQDLSRLNLVFCCKCNSADLEVCCTSNPRDCTCAQHTVQSKVACGRWENASEAIGDEWSACRLSGGAALGDSHICTTKKAEGGSMVCQRCKGLLVREIFDDLSVEASITFLATRCINCGYIEDSVVRANRLHHPTGTHSASCGIVKKGGVVFLYAHPGR